VVDSTNNEAISVAALSHEALPNTYVVEIFQLAQSHQVASDFFQSRFQALGLEGSFGLDGYHVDVERADTLYGIMESVNAVDDITLTAKIDESSHGFRLVFTKIHTGDMPISIGDDNGLLLKLGFLTRTVGDDLVIKHELVPPQKAVFGVNERKYESQSNLVSDIIEGVSFELHQQTGDDGVTLVLEPSIVSSQTLITGFVEAYNDAMEYINSRYVGKYVNSGDSTLHGIRFKVSAAAINPVPDLATTRFDSLKDIGLPHYVDRVIVNEGVLEQVMYRLAHTINQPLAQNAAMIPSIYNTIGQVGIISGRDNTLYVDEGRIEEVLSHDLSDVMHLFSSEKGVGNRLKSVLENVVDEELGTIAIHKKGLEELAKYVQLDKTRWDLSERLKRFYQMEAGIPSQKLQLLI
jgi:flagellar capping protein FliD